MTVSKARDDLKGARRELADAIDSLPNRMFALRGREKRNKIKRAIGYIDKSIQELRGL